MYVALYSLVWVLAEVFGVVSASSFPGEFSGLVPTCCYNLCFAPPVAVMSWALNVNFSSFSVSSLAVESMFRRMRSLIVVWMRLSVATLTCLFPRMSSELMLLSCASSMTFTCLNPRLSYSFVSLSSSFDFSDWYSVTSVFRCSFLRWIASLMDSSCVYFGSTAYPVEVKVLFSSTLFELRLLWLRWTSCSAGVVASSIYVLLMMWRGWTVCYVGGFWCLSSVLLATWLGLTACSAGGVVCFTCTMLMIWFGWTYCSASHLSGTFLFVLLVISSLWFVFLSGFISAISFDVPPSVIYLLCCYCYDLSHCIQYEYDDCFYGFSFVMMDMCVCITYALFHVYLLLMRRFSFIVLLAVMLGIFWEGILCGSLPCITWGGCAFMMLCYIVMYGCRVLVDICTLLWP